MKIASSPAECLAWKGLAVVVDVLRCSTNICAMLKRGKPCVRIYADKKKAVAWHKAHPVSDFFSELEFPPEFAKYDNSPWQALKSDPARPAVLVTGAGTKAVIGLKNASEVYIGCFANFPCAVSKLKQTGKPALIVPAGIFYLGHIEDALCAAALKAAAAGEPAAAKRAMSALKKSGRIEEFLAMRKETGEKDVALALNIGGLAVLPKIEVFGDYGIASDSLKNDRKKS